ncbi:MAG TPA: helix-turn-helix transcriptional regulator [Mycobacteriales bacterium]|nr:helix-turn-helix transcriptional regulator [Mycobacteriales bacterium]
MRRVLTGAELRALREARNWSQTALSRRTGVTRNYLSMIENGQRPGSAQFWRLVGRIFDEEEEAAVRRAEFLRLSAAAVTATAVAPCAQPDPATRLGRQIFSGIAAGDSRMFAGSQTTHATDLVIGGYVSKHQASRRLLGRWMRHPANPVLQVNAAGVLAKLNEPDATDEVIESLRGDERVRRLYVTAVASRVLRMPWGHAGMLAGATDGGTVKLADHHQTALLDELDNARDGAARWCALRLLGDNAARSRDLLLQRLQVEQSRETLRALGSALAHSSS